MIILKVFLMKNIVLMFAISLSNLVMATTVDLNHPNVLIEKFQVCQLQPTPSEECLEIKRVVTMIHHNVQALEQNQQQVGLEIMALQNQIQALKNQKKASDLNKIAILQEQLDVMLATVSWLESPK